MLKRRLAFCVALIMLFLLVGCNAPSPASSKGNSDKTFRLLCSSENKDLESMLKEYAKGHKIDLEIDYAGTLEIMELINRNSSNYDAVWLSNSIWLYMLDNPSVIKNSRSTSVNPVVFGVKQSIAKSLGWIDMPVSMQQIIAAVEEGKFHFLMPSVTQTNSGATAYLGFLSALSGSDSVLTSEALENPTIKKSLMQLFKGVERSSGSDEFLNELFQSKGYEALVGYESSIIALNKSLTRENKEPLYLIYPENGLSLSDSPFGYVDNGNTNKEEAFKEMQSFLLSADTQEELTQTGRRAGYGGLVPYGTKEVFNPQWGIHIDQYLFSVNYPSATVIRQALNLYQSALRKPSYTVFCLDISGSMDGDGIESLREAMQYILTEEQASKEFLQFMNDDQVIIIPFNHYVQEPLQASGSDLSSLIYEVNDLYANGRTSIYDAALEGVMMLQNVNPEEYTRTVVLMTDGEDNSRSTIKSFTREYNKIGQDIPVYSIMFGEASDHELSEIASATNAKVFDGRKDLVYAFRQVRGFN